MKGLPSVLGFSNFAGGERTSETVHAARTQAIPGDRQSFLKCRQPKCSPPPSLNNHFRSPFISQGFKDDGSSVALKELGITPAQLCSAER